MDYYLPYSQKIWHFGGMPFNDQNKISTFCIIIRLAMLPTLNPPILFNSIIVLYSCIKLNKLTKFPHKNFFIRTCPLSRGLGESLALHVFKIKIHVGVGMNSKEREEVLVLYSTLVLAM